MLLKGFYGNGTCKKNVSFNDAMLLLIL